MKSTRSPHLNSICIYKFGREAMTIQNGHTHPVLFELSDVYKIPNSRPCSLLFGWPGSSGWCGWVFQFSNFYLDARNSKGYCLMQTFGKTKSLDSANEYSLWIIFLNRLQNKWWMKQRCFNFERFSIPREPCLFSG